jgi:DNA-binding NarL/FixJ family response regulator
MPRIGVLSNHELYRDGIVEILRQHGFKHVDGFSSCRSLLRATRGAPLDLALVDLPHEKEDQEDVTHRLRTLWPDVTIVAIGTPLQLAARAPGVDGYVELPSEGTSRLSALAEAVARLPHGPVKFAVSPELARQTRTWASLTPRQRQVLGLLGCGLENLKIAASLAISERAVKGHIGVLFDRFGVDNRTALALIACRAGFAPG